MSRARTPSPFPTANVVRLPQRLVAPRTRPARPPRSERAGAVGAQIKALRAVTGTSGGELARCAGVSRSMLSRVERGLASPSVETLERIATAMGVSISRFFTQRAERVDFLHVPAGHGIPVDSLAAATGGRYELLGHLLSGDLSVAPSLVQIDASDETPAALTHQGLKFIYVLSGKARYRYGPRHVSLGAGDALLFDASAAHGVVRVDEAPMNYLCAVFSLRT